MKAMDLIAKPFTDNQLYMANVFEKSGYLEALNRFDKEGN